MGRLGFLLRYLVLAVCPNAFTDISLPTSGTACPSPPYEPAKRRGLRRELRRKRDLPPDCKRLRQEPRSPAPMWPASGPYSHHHRLHTRASTAEITSRILASQVCSDMTCLQALLPISTSLFRDP